MQRFRKIVVNGLEYKWMYRQGRKGKPPYLLVAAKAAPQITLRLVFSAGDDFCLNSGFPAAFQGERVVINLNQPALIAQIIQWLQEQKDLLNGAKEQKLDGIALLKALGYELAW